MIGMEKVINGLYETIDVIHSFVPKQYWYDTETPCSDAIALLKAQLPAADAIPVEWLIQRRDSIAPAVTVGSAIYWLLDQWQMDGERRDDK